VNRRDLLKLLTAASVLVPGQQLLAQKPLRVVVAGAGIVGASIAWHLAKAGALVTVIDKEGPATHASRGTFAWINATWAKQPHSYHSLNQESVSNWANLQQALNLPVRWGGSIEWFATEARQNKLAEQIAEQASWGEAASMVNAEQLRAMEPHIDFSGAQRAGYSANDGTVDPVMATKLLLRAAEKMGATVKYPCELTGVNRGSGRLTAVETSLGSIRADRLVLATGASPDTCKRFADIDIPQRSTPGVIAISAPTPRLVNRVIAAPGVHFHQRDDGRLVLGEQGGAPPNEAHAERLSNRPNQFPAPALAAEHAARILAVAKRFVPELPDVPIEQVNIGWRPLPLDGHPVLGASPARRDVYIALMHSGVSLAPIVGQLTAHELLNDAAVERLETFRPGRKFENIKWY
jgi:glycine/D-amino acid oxidase-like deaminating enzyme